MIQIVKKIRFNLYAVLSQLCINKIEIHRQYTQYIIFEMFIKRENNVGKINSPLNACSNNNWRGARMRDGGAAYSLSPRGCFARYRAGTI